jgi:hypothetical protein
MEIISADSVQVWKEFAFKKIYCSLFGCLFAEKMREKKKESVGN